MVDTQSECEAPRRSRRPPLRQTLAEAIAVLTPAPPMALDTRLAHLPRGDGHAVLVLPALLRSDRYTEQVRHWLTKLGYTPFGWGLGVNIGPTQRLLDGAIHRLIEITDRHGPVSLVGFSMGGLFARWLSQRYPERVRQVITICSPIHDAAENFWFPLDPLLDMWPGVDVAKLADEVAQPMPVPLTCVLTRDDGVVNWIACRDDEAAADDVIEISGPHSMISRNPDVMVILAKRLARRFDQKVS